MLNSNQRNSRRKLVMFGRACKRRDRCRQFWSASLTKKVRKIASGERGGKWESDSERHEDAKKVCYTQSEMSAKLKGTEENSVRR